MDTAPQMPAAQLPDVRWSLDGGTGTVTANGHYAGTVVESLPGKLYYIKGATYDDGFQPGMYPTAERAVQQSAMRSVSHQWMAKHPAISQTRH